MNQLDIAIVILLAIFLVLTGMTLSLVLRNWDAMKRDYEGFSKLPNGKKFNLYMNLTKALGVLVLVCVVLGKFLRG